MIGPDVFERFLYYAHPKRLHRTLRSGVPQKALRDHVNRLRFGPEFPRSDQAIFVDPAEVTEAYDAKAAGLELRRRDSARVVGGDWDLHRKPLKKSKKYKSCRKHFRKGVPWSETAIYAQLLEQIAAGERPDALASEDDVAARYAALDRLYEQTRALGRFKLRRELPECFRDEHGGILVHVARDGTCLRSGGGNHRWAIAKLLKLPEIPAQIGAVHPDAVRDGHLQRLLTPRAALPEAAQGAQKQADPADE